MKLQKVLILIAILTASLAVGLRFLMPLLENPVCVITPEEQNYGRMKFLAISVFAHNLDLYLHPEDGTTPLLRNEDIAQIYDLQGRYPTNETGQVVDDWGNPYKCAVDYDHLYVVSSGPDGVHSLDDQCYVMETDIFADFLNANKRLHETR